MIVRNYSELVEQLTYLLVAPFRFYEAFKVRPFLYWVSEDIDIPEIEKIFGKKNLLIKWEKKTWKKIGKDIRQLIGRELLIRKEWFIELRDNFTVREII
ncbi:MAG: hypothetical protein ACFFCZ_20185 [Promethearchaeota archaeon]